MAKRQFMSKRLRSRTVLRQKEMNSVIKPLNEQIEDERDRLSTVQSLLRCVQVSMCNSDAEEDDDLPYYPDLIAIAYTMVRESIDKLDSAHRYPVIEKLKKAAARR